MLLLLIVVVYRGLMMVRGLRRRALVILGLRLVLLMALLMLLLLVMVLVLLLVMARLGVVLRVDGRSEEVGVCGRELAGELAGSVSHALGGEGDMAVLGSLLARIPRDTHFEVQVYARPVGRVRWIHSVCCAAVLARCSLGGDLDGDLGGWSVEGTVGQVKMSRRLFVCL